MTVKISIAAFLIFGLSNVSTAQNSSIKDSAGVVTLPLAKIDTSKSKKRCSATVEIGLNANTFIKQFLSFNTFLANNQQPYIVTGKLIFNSKFAIRTGVGFTNSASKSSDLTTNSGSITSSSPITTKQANSSLDARFGLEYQKWVSAKWRYYVGADFIMGNVTIKQESFNQQTSTSTNYINGQAVTTVTTFTTVNKTSTLSNNYGGAAVIGVQYNINKRISLFTETNAVLLTGKSKSVTERTTSSDNPYAVSSNSSSKNENKSSGTSFGINLPVTLYVAIKL